MLSNLRERRLGNSARSKTKAHNEVLLGQMPNVRGVADLERLRSQRTLADQVSEVLSSMQALVHARIIPRSSMVSESWERISP